MGVAKYIYIYQCCIRSVPDNVLCWAVFFFFACFQSILKMPYNTTSRFRVVFLFHRGISVKYFVNILNFFNGYFYGQKF
jgi:hypothetical protein